MTKFVPKSYFDMIERDKENNCPPLYLRQEGNGIGLTNKLKTYALQDQGMNIVVANLALGFEDVQWDYHLAGHMLKRLGVKSVGLLTNNSQKLLILQQRGIEITEQVKHIYPENSQNIHYLETKKKISGHLFDPDMSTDQYLRHQKH